jgi:hypothetical protein
MQGALVGPLTSRTAAELLSRVVDAPTQAETTIMLAEPRSEAAGSKTVENGGLGLTTQSQSGLASPTHHGKLPVYG